VALGPRVIDLFLETPGLSFAPAEFVGLLKPLAPRLYSISSGRTPTAGSVHLTVNIVRYDSWGRTRKGVVFELPGRPGQRAISVPVFVQKSHAFRLPPAARRPSSWLGRGPASRRFARSCTNARPPAPRAANWLFFGEQRAADGFLLSRRAGSDAGIRPFDPIPHGVFPRPIGQSLRPAPHPGGRRRALAWLQEGAHFYVCGDASRMAKDVDAALHRAAEMAGGLSPEAAGEFVQTLKTEKRYLRDVTKHEHRHHPGHAYQGRTSQ